MASRHCDRSADDPRDAPVVDAGPQVRFSLSRLLPGIEINKEFTEFFCDPDCERRKAWRSLFFSGYVVIG